MDAEREGLDMVWILAGLEAAIYGLAAAAWMTRVVRDRAGRRRPKRPRGTLRTVRGIARGPHGPSPFEKVPCLFAWVRLVSENNPFHRVTREFAVGPDFVLDSPEGAFVVRLDGLRLRGAPAFSPLQPVEEAPEGQAARVIEETGMQKPRWTEIHVRAGDELEVTGVCRMEPGLQPGAGLRDAALSPTLSGAGGRLDVLYIR